MPVPVVLADVTLAETTVGVAYTTTFTASGGAAPFTYAATGLPAGLSLSSAGVLSGTATAAGDFTLHLTATDSVGTEASHDYALKIFAAPAITTAALPGATAGWPYSAALTATGGKAPLTFSVSAGELPAALTFTGSTLSGTPPSAGTIQFTLQVQDAHGATATQALRIDVATALAMTTASLPDGNVGTAYAQVIQASGGKTPIAFSHSAGTLPPGLSLDAAGALTGTPTIAGTFGFSVSATDANGAVASVALSVQAHANAPPAVATSSLPTGVVGAAYSGGLSASGGEPPYAWSLTSGALPAGLSLSSSGNLSGTPTTAETASFQVQVSDTHGQTARRALSLTVNTALTLTTASVPEAYATEVYPATSLAASGGQTPYSWTLAGGALPTGVTLTAGGILSGTPTTPGAFGFTLAVADGSGQSVTRAFSTTIHALPAITTSSLGDAVRSVAYSQPVFAAGGKAPVTFDLASGSVPAGLTLSPAGTISGTPTATGTASFVVRATDANGRLATRPLSVAVFDALTITSSALSDGYVTEPFSEELGVAGGNAPYSWVLSSGTLPPGLALAGNGTVSGTPTATGTTNFTVRVTDASSQTTTRAVTMTVRSLPAISSAPLTDVYRGEAYSTGIAVTGGRTPYVYTLASGSPPAGLTLSSAGVLSGTTTAGSASFTVRVTDANGRSATRDFTLPTYALPAIAPPVLADAYVGSSYSAGVGATGGKGPLAYELQSGLLPDGLVLAAGSGALSGAATTSGTSTFVVMVTDANGRSATSGSLTLAVYAPPAVTTGTIPDGTVGQSYSQLLSVSGGKGPLAWTNSSGALPTGISLLPSGTLSGTPSASGTSTFAVTVTDANGRSGTRSLTMAVFNSLTITSASPLPDAFVGVSYGLSLSSAGGRSPYGWAHTGGTLPPGVTLSAGGVLSGSPTAAGTYSFTVTVTDANTTSASKTVTVTAVPRPSITTLTLPDGYLGLSYVQEIDGANGKLPYGFAVTSGTLPSGIVLDPDTGELAGSPSTSGPSTFTVTLTDANGLTAARSYTVGAYLVPAVSTASPLPEGYVDSAFTLDADVIGGKAPFSWSVLSGAPATGLSFTSSGELSGTPTATGAFTFTLRVTDANGQSASKGFTHVIRTPPAFVTPALLPDGYTGRAYSRSLDATGGKSPYVYAATGLPAGLTLSSGGALTGAPAAAGVSAIAATVTDANNVSASRAFTFTAYDPPAIGAAPLADAYAGSAYSVPLSVTGGKSGFTWTSIGGVLPTGISLGSNGTLAGTTTDTGTFSFTAQVTDSNLVTATRALTLTVLSPLELPTSSLADAYSAQAYSSGVTAVGGKTPYAYSISAGALPSGITLDPATGAIAGSSTVTGTASFTVQVRDANNRIVQRPLTLAVLSVPAISSTPLIDGYALTAYSASIATSGGRTPLSFTLTGSPPPGLSFSSGGAISGLPSAAGTYSLAVTVTDANGRTGSGSVSLTIYGALQVTTGSLPDGYPSTAYSGTLDAVGGKAPLTWTSSTLPATLNLSSAGALSGTPAAVGSTAVTFTVRDANLVTASRVLSLEVLTPPSITTASLPDAYPGTPYSQELSGTGGRQPYRYTSGTLPAGLSLALDGTLSGLATTPGLTVFTVTLTDANGRVATRSLSVTVRDPLVVDPPTLQDPYTDTAYSGAVSATGGRTPYGWTIASGALPAGMTLDPVTGSLGGTPASAGTSSFTVRVTDANGVTANRALVLQSYAPPAITSSATLPDAYQDVSYSQPLAASGGKTPLLWTLAVGSPPSGISVASSGTVSGAASAPGSTTFTVRVTDANGRAATRALTLTVNAGFNIVTSSLNDLYTGTAFTHTLAASGGALPYSNWSVISGALPSGLSLNAGTGELSGTPTATGAFTFTVRVQDNNTALTQRTFTQTVYAPPSVVTPSLTDAYLGEAYIQNLSSSGGKSPLLWSVTSGSLPAGLSLTPSSGAISGAATASGTASFTVTVTDATGRSASRALTVGAYAPLVADTSALADAYLGTPYLASLGASGGKPSLAWSLTSGALPAGVTLTPGTGALSGTPTATGTATFTALVTDGNGRTSSRTASIAVLSPLSVDVPTLAEGYLTVPYSGTLTATGGATPYAWTVSSGAPPPGVTFADSGDSAVLSGTPTTPGTYAFTARVQDRNGVFATRALQIIVAPALTLPAAALADAYRGTAYSGAVVATGGRSPYSYSLSSGTLPAGISLTPAGALTGTPTAESLASFVVQVADANGTTATRGLSLEVVPPLLITSLPYADPYLGEAYSVPNSVTGGRGPYSWTVSSGALPPGVNLASTSGTLAGSATTTGSYPFTLSVQDANGVIQNLTRTLTVYAPVAMGGGTPPDAYTGDAYSFALSASGGKTPLSWSQSSGALPPGVLVTPAGQLSGTVGLVANGASFSAQVRVTDANGRTALRTVALQAFLPPSVTTASLINGTEGVTYFRAPGVNERIDFTGGKAPLSLGVTGLPASLSAAATGVITGTPLPGQAAAYSVVATVTDANNRAVPRTLPMQVLVPTPILGSGTSSVAPAGSAITDYLTVFVTDANGQRRSGYGVRVRKNGVEYTPVKQALSDSNGKVFFSGLGLNGTTDTVDITVNGVEASTYSLGKVNAALVTAMPSELPNRKNRYLGAAAFDSARGEAILTSGLISGFASARGSCNNELVTLASTGVATEKLPAGSPNLPPVRYSAGLAYAGGGRTVLFGGASCDSNALLSDTWIYDSAANSMTQVVNGGPDGRYQFAMSQGFSGTDVYLHGGISDLTAYETWRFDTSSGAWTLLPEVGTLVNRSAHAMVRLPASARLLLCGGSGTPPRAECYFNTVGTSSNWTVAPSLPSGRSLHAMSADGTGGGAFVFGGRGTGSVERNDLLYFNGTAWTTLTANGAAGSPPARYGASMWFDTARGELVLTGGRNVNSGAAGATFRDVWVWNGTAWQERDPAVAGGFTVSGSITGGHPTSAGAFARVSVSGTSGFNRTVRVKLTGGNASYSVPSVPAGDTVEVTAVSEDLGTAITSVSSGPLGPVGGDTTHNVVFGANQPLELTALTLTKPPEWRVHSLSAAAYLADPVFPAKTQTASRVFASGTLSGSLPFLPGTAPKTAFARVFADTIDPAVCEGSQRGFVPAATTTLALFAGARSLSPGTTVCHPQGSGIANGVMNYAFGSVTQAAIGVLDGDLYPDVAVASRLEGRVSVLTNPDGSGLSEVWFTNVVSEPSDVAILKANNDAFADLVVVSRSSDQLYLFYGVGDGTFTNGPVVAFGGTNQAVKLAVGNFNGDGYPDVAVLCQGTSTVRTFYGDATGGFFPGGSSPLSGFQPRTMAAGDLNGDGLDDLAVALPFDNRVQILRGGGGSFFPVANLSGMGSNPISVVIAEVTHDTTPDVVVGYGGDGRVLIYRNDAVTGTFTGLLAATVPQVRAVAVADFNDDDKGDLVVLGAQSAPGPEFVKLYLTAPGGTVTPYTSQRTFGGSGVLAANLDLDSDADVLVLSEANATLQQFSGARPRANASDTWSFTLPANTTEWWLSRGPQGYSEFTYEQPTTSTTVASFVMPLPSTLVPSRAARSGDTVQWDVSGAVYAPGTFNWNDIRWRFSEAEGYFYSNGIEYRRN